MRKTVVGLVLVVAVSGLVPATAFAIDSWSVFTPLEHATHIPKHILAYAFVALLLSAVAIKVGGDYRKKLAEFEIWRKKPVDSRGPSPVAPSPRFSIGNAVESVLQGIMNLSKDIIGPTGPRYIPLIATLAFVIWVANVISLVPGLDTPNTNWNTTIAMAITAFLLYHFYGIQEHGLFKYLQQFLGPLEGPLRIIMAPLMIPIELIGHFARVLSLSLRLLGNMTGDHTLLVVFLSFVAVPLIYPLPFYFLGLLVSTIQAFVFALLCIIYISLAVSHEH